jgi:hypothetical protein
LASKPKNTAACRLNWQGNEASDVSLGLNITDEILLELASTAEKVGIDVPFGWPDPFVRAVTAHHLQQQWPPTLSNDLRLRRTDVLVWRAIRKQPLSVSTDKIAIPALRMAALMVKLAEAGRPVDRTGEGLFVEVYPAAALRRWGIANAKKDTPQLLPTLLSRAPWLKLSDEAMALCSRSRDAIDSLVAALAARAAALGLCDQLPEAERQNVAGEGWIALPMAGSLERLPGAQANG